MAKKTVGALIKEARTAAGLSQTKLAEKVDNVTASDIGKAERDEKDLTKEALKQIAKATGVTQKSLLEAPSGVKKSDTASSSSKKTSSSSKKTSSSSKKTSSSSKKDEELKLTSTEKKLVELYRAADSDTKKKATSILKGEKEGLQAIFSEVVSGMGTSELLQNILGALGSRGMDTTRLAGAISENGEGEVIPLKIIE